MLSPNRDLIAASATAVCVEKLDAAVVPSRFASTMIAHPSAVSDVSTGMGPAASENVLNVNVLPEVEIPSDELKAGP